ncbi:MAG: hypothetical protein ACYDIA_11245 [Candidatus Humimicrobiaceae bacterium]
MENNCPLQSTEKRLNDCLSLWEKAKSSYFEPDSFILNLNNLIQTLRSVTFILQKNKDFLPSFNNWYNEWQLVMKQDKILIWLVKARNYIEKEGDLKTLSKVRLSIVNSYLEPPIFEKEIPPFIKNEEFLKIITEIKPKKINLQNGFLRAERLWIDSKLESRELIEATGYVYIFLLNLIIDAHHKLIDSETKNNCNWYNKNIRSLPTTLAMINQDWNRTIWMDLATKETILPDMKTINLDNKLIAKAKKRYGNLENFKSELKNAKNLKSEAKILFKQAKLLLLKDGYHSQIVILGYADGHSRPILFNVENRKEKYLFFRYIASIVKETFVKSVILISEAWMSALKDIPLYLFPSDDPDREEALSLVAANSKGEKYSFTVFFSKDKHGNIILGREFSDEGTKDYASDFLIPILTVWNQSL